MSLRPPGVKMTRPGWKPHPNNELKDDRGRPAVP